MLIYASDWMAAECSGGGVLRVRFSGLVRASALRAGKRDLVAQLTTAGMRPAAVVADYGACVLAVTEGELRSMMAGWQDEDLPHLPAAVVAPCGWLEHMREAALDAAVATGAWRLVLDDPLDADLAIRQALRLRADATGTRQK